MGIVGFNLRRFPLRDSNLRPLHSKPLKTRFFSLDHHHLWLKNYTDMITCLCLIGIMADHMVLVLVSESEQWSLSHVLIRFFRDCRWNLKHAQNFLFIYYFFMRTWYDTGLCFVFLFHSNHLNPLFGYAIGDMLSHCFNFHAILTEVNRKACFMLVLIVIVAQL